MSPAKLVSEIEINAPAEKFYKIFKHQSVHVPNITPKVIQQVQVHEGDWDSHGHGSIKIWNYTVEGKDEVFKERVEYDDKKLAVIMTGLEGDVFNYYKTYKVIFQVVPKDPTHSLAVLTIEYEKLNEDAPYPYKYLDLLNSMAKDIEAHLK